MAQIIATVIFLVMFLLIISEKLERHIVTLLSGLLTLVLVFGVCMHSMSAVINTLNFKEIGTLTFWYQAGEAAETSSGINWATIIFIAGMMIMVEGMMFVLDIDNFKKINDTMGHAFGDEVLKTLGRTISSLFRVTDIIGRTGGDEFTIFLKFLKSDENTLKEARKLVQFFKDFTAGEYVKYSATASIGAAVFPENGSDFDSLYKAADKALYKAKQRGKNQLAFYDDRDRK